MRAEGSKPSASGSSATWGAQKATSWESDWGSAWSGGATTWSADDYAAWNATHSTGALGWQWKGNTDREAVPTKAPEEAPEAQPLAPPRWLRPAALPPMPERPAPGLEEPLPPEAAPEAPEKDSAHGQPVIRAAGEEVGPPTNTADEERSRTALGELGSRCATGAADVHEEKEALIEAKAVDGVCAACKSAYALGAQNCRRCGKPRDEAGNRPTHLDTLLAKLFARHPPIARDIGKLAATSLKFKYLQASAGADKANIQEVWDELPPGEQEDLIRAFELGDGARDEWFLAIVEEEQLQRNKLGEPQEKPQEVEVAPSLVPETNGVEEQLPEVEVLQSIEPDPADHGKDAFVAWLLEVAPTGSLSVYAEALEERYDTVDQIVRLYSDTELFDAAFFDDAGVVDPEHRQLFSEWFSRHELKDQLPQDSPSIVHTEEGCEENLLEMSAAVSGQSASSSCVDEELFHLQASKNASSSGCCAPFCLLWCGRS